MNNLPFQYPYPVADSDLNARYRSLASWVNWLPQVTKLIEQAKLPPEVKGELTHAVTIQGDNILDSFLDELGEHHRKFYLRDANDEEIELIDNTLQEFAQLNREVGDDNTADTYHRRVRMLMLQDAIRCSINATMLKGWLKHVEAEKESYRQQVPLDGSR